MLKLPTLNTVIYNSFVVVKLLATFLCYRTGTVILDLVVFIEIKYRELLAKCHGTVYQYRGQSVLERAQ